MYGQGSYHQVPGQGPPMSGRPPFQQLPPPPPRTFHQNPQVPPSRPGQPGMAVYQHAPHVRPFPPGQPYVHGPPAAHGNVAMSHMYTTSQPPSYLLPSRPALPLGSNSMEVSRAPLSSVVLLPTPPPGKMVYGANVHQPPQKLPPPPLRPTSVPLTSAPPSVGSSQIYSMPPPLLPPRPPSSLPLPVSSHENNQGKDSLSLKRSTTIDASSPPKPLEMSYSMQPNQDSVAAESHSPADSDMEMEDDITQSENHAANNSAGQPTNNHDLIGSDFYVKGSSYEQLTFEKPVSKAHSTVINSGGVVECPSASNVENSATPVLDSKNSMWTSQAAECINPDECPGQVTEVGNPFRLIQDYASDESSDYDVDHGLNDGLTERISSTAVGTENLSGSNDLNLETASGSKSPYTIEKGVGTGLLSESKLSRGPEPCSDLQGEVKEAGLTSMGSEPISKYIDTNDECHASVCTTSPRDLSKEIASGGGTSVNVTFNGKFQKGYMNKTANITSDVCKIDKFGRLVKEGMSDSDSDDSYYGGIRTRRGRSRSRSRSPLDRRRKRSRSPRRRRDRRSRSRSWSPRYKRRSRSPNFRHASGNMRQDRGQLGECFAFNRGKCYRGASCRYRHHDSGKIDGSRRHRSNQQNRQLNLRSKTSNTDEETMKTSVKSDHDHSQGMHYNNVPVDVGATKDSIDHKRESVSEAPQCIISSEGGHLSHFNTSIFDKFKEISEKEPKTKMVRGAEDGSAHADENFLETTPSDQPLVADNFLSQSCSEVSQNVTSLKDSVIRQSQSDLSDPVLEGAAHAPRQTDDSSISDSSPDKTSKTPRMKLPTSETIPNVTNSVHNPSHLSSLPQSPLLSEINPPNTTQPMMDYKLMPQAARFQSHSASLESFPYMLSNQKSMFSVPPNSCQTSLLPKVSVLPAYDASANVGAAPPSVSMQFQQSYLPPKNDLVSQIFSRPYAVELGGRSQVVESQHGVHPPMQGHLYSCNQSNQLSGGPALPMQGLNGSASFTQEHRYRLPVPSSQEPPTTKLQSFSVDSLQPGAISNSSQIHPSFQQQQSPYALCNALPDGVYGLAGKMNSLSRHPPDDVDRNQLALPPDFALSSSIHYNSYASTFDQPLSSRFSSDVLKQEKDKLYSDKLDPQSGLNHNLDGRSVGSTESRQVATIMNSSKGVGQNMPGSGDDQYDPLFDSFEPLSNSNEKFDHVQKGEQSNDSDFLLKMRLSGSNKTSGVEENTKKEEVGSIVVASSVNNEEFGETADAEVGEFENVSQSDHNTPENMNSGEVEIDQIKSPRKTKKSKDSRSMKLFKVALAEFVKDVLKPSWRQGNMSKEAFKTVVKKAVDKVSGAMKGHQIPKSRAKIDHYIDSSQRKLTKLVMGYVDKYAKG